MQALRVSLHNCMAQQGQGLVQAFALALVQSCPRHLLRPLANPLQSLIKDPALTDGVKALMSQVLCSQQYAGKCAYTPTYACCLPTMLQVRIVVFLSGILRKVPKKTHVHDFLMVAYVRHQYMCNKPTAQTTCNCALYMKACFVFYCCRPVWRSLGHRELSAVLSISNADTISQSQQIECPGARLRYSGQRRRNIRCTFGI